MYKRNRFLMWPGVTRCDQILICQRGQPNALITFNYLGKISIYSLDKAIICGIFSQCDQAWPGVTSYLHGEEADDPDRELSGQELPGGGASASAVDSSAVAVEQLAVPEKKEPRGFKWRAASIWSITWAPSLRSSRWPCPCCWPCRTDKSPEYLII